MSNRLHVAAAALQLNRKLFNGTNQEGSVTADNDNLQVVVHGFWDKPKISAFADYTVTWIEASAPQR